jgi:hypothetical protein
MLGNTSQAKLTDAGSGSARLRSLDAVSNLGGGMLSEVLLSRQREA